MSGLCEGASLAPLNARPSAQCPSTLCEPDHDADDDEPDDDDGDDHDNHHDGYDKNDDVIGGELINIDIAVDPDKSSQCSRL